MPIAWLTFWKANWGTRDTPADVAEKEKKEKAKAQAQTKNKAKIQEGKA